MSVDAGTVAFMPTTCSTHPDGPQPAPRAAVDAATLEAIRAHATALAAAAPPLADTQLAALRRALHLELTHPLAAPSQTAA